MCVFCLRCLCVLFELLCDVVLCVNGLVFCCMCPSVRVWFVCDLWCDVVWIVLNCDLSVSCCICDVWLCVFVFVGVCAKCVCCLWLIVWWCMVCVCDLCSVVYVLRCVLLFKSGCVFCL